VYWSDECLLTDAGFDVRFVKNVVARRRGSVRDGFNGKDGGVVRK